MFMQVDKLIFSNKFPAPIVRHTLFWLFYYLYQVMLFLYNNSNVQTTFWLTFIERCEKLLRVFPFSIIQCYIIMYWLVPKFFSQKKYFLFVTGLFITSAGVVYCVDKVTFNRFDFASLWIGLMSYIQRGGPVLCILFIIIKTVKTWYLKEREKELLLKENLSAELQLLNAQIHPHFLFNTFNNIYSFILSDSEKAQNHVKKLEEILRYMITECNQPFVPLSKEINLLKDYIELEKVRYGNNLNLEIKIPDGRNKLIAPLLMIPFIENSFKHGASKILENPWIKLNIEVKENTLYFNLINSKPKSEILVYKKKWNWLNQCEEAVAAFIPGKPLLKNSIVNWQVYSRGKNSFV